VVRVAHRPGAATAASPRPTNRAHGATWIRDVGFGIAGASLPAEFYVTSLSLQRRGRCVDRNYGHRATDGSRSPEIDTVSRNRRFGRVSATLDRNCQGLERFPQWFFHGGFSPSDSLPDRVP